MSQPPEDLAKERARELRGLIKDAKQAARELDEKRALLKQEVSAALAAFSDQGAQMLAYVGGQHCEALNDFLKGYLRDVTAAVEESTARIMQLAAELAGIIDPDEFLAAVVRQLSPMLSDAVDEKLTAIEKEVVPVLVRETIADMILKQRKAPTPEKPNLPPASLTHIPAALQRTRVTRK